jgi:hypothetical protein
MESIFLTCQFLLLSIEFMRVKEILIGVFIHKTFYPDTLKPRGIFKKASISKIVIE